MGKYTIWAMALFALLLSYAAQGAEVSNLGELSTCVCEGEPERATTKTVTRKIIVYYEHDDDVPRWDYSENRKAFVELVQMVQTLSAKSEVQTVMIKGGASPMGTEDYNNKIALRRAEALRSSISRMVGGDRLNIEVSVVGEDWLSFISEVERNYYESDREAVLAIMGNDVSVAEKKQQLELLDEGKSWEVLATNYMASSRTVVVIYTVEEPCSAEQPTVQPTAQPMTKKVAQPTTKPITKKAAQKTEQPTARPTAEKTAEKVEQPTAQKTTEKAEQPTDSKVVQSTKQPIAQPSKQPIVLPAKRPIARPIQQPTVQPTTQSTEQVVEQSAVQPTAQPTTQSTEQVVEQSAVQPTVQPTTQSTEQVVEQPTVQSTAQPTTQSTEQVVEQPTVQSAIQPIEEVVIEPRKIVVAARTNLLVPALNVGVEVPIGNNWSVGADYYFPWIWPKKDNKNCFEFLGWGIEGRYWFGKNRTQFDRLQGHSVGVYGYVGYYDFERNFHGHQGEYVNVGVDYTYAMAVGKRKSLHLEFSLGLGYIYSKARKYTVIESQGPLISDKITKNIRFFGPTKANISLVVPIFQKVKPSNKANGDE